MNNDPYLYEQMPVSRALMTLSVPTVLSQLITVVYNMADTFFIGQLNDPAQVAAASLSMPPFVLLTGIANLFGIGGASLIARCLGRQEPEKARQAAAFCVRWALRTALIYGLLFLPLKPLVLPLLGAKTTTYDYCYQYLFWTVTVGAVPTVFSACLAHLIRAQGMARQAGFGIALGGVLNMALDPLLIFGFKMGITGAAVATALSNFLAALYFILVICRKKDAVGTLRRGSPARGMAKEVLAVGLPSFCMTVLAIVSNTVLNNLMANASDAAVAGMGIAKKIDMLTFAVATGMTQGVISLIGYSYAAKDYRRMRQAVQLQFAYTMALAVLTTLFLYFCAVPIARSFIADAETVAYGQRFLRIICLICPMQAVSFMATAVFQAMGRKYAPLVLSFLRKGAVDTPIMYLLNALAGVSAVAWATPAAELAACIAAAVMFVPMWKKLTLDH